MSRTLPALDRVTAVVLDDGAQPLSDVLDALATQVRAPDALILVYPRGSSDSVRMLREHAALDARVGDLRSVSVDPFADWRTSMAAATHVLSAAGDGDAGETDGGDRDAGINPGDTSDERHWLWVLTSHAVPDDDALASLLVAPRRSSAVGLVAPKLLDGDRGGAVLHVGHRVSRSGRLAPAPRLGEPDQGQYDTRADLLAAVLPGSLVRRDVLQAVGGIDEFFADYAAGLDLGWRAQLAGHRVVLASDARITVFGASGAPSQGPDAGAVGVPGRVGSRAPLPPLLAELGAGRTGDVSTRLRSRQAALTRTSAWLAPLRALWLVVSGLVMSLVMLVFKRPREAWAEVADIRAAFTPIASLRARWRFRHARRLSPGNLHGVFVPAGAVRRQLTDSLIEGLPVRRSAHADEHLGGERIWRPGLGAAVLSNPGLWATVVATLLSAWWWRDVIAHSAVRGSGHGLAGGHLNGLEATADGLWWAWQDGWQGSGLSTQPAEPFAPVLAGMTWLAEWLPWVDERTSPAGTTIAWLFLAAIPLACVSAYLAARIITRRPWPRALVALAWAANPLILDALRQGRLTAVGAHILLPLGLAGALHLSRRTAGPTGTGAVIIVWALLGALVPLWLPVATVFGLVAAVRTSGWSRLRGLALAVMPWLMQGPWLVHYWREPARLMGTGDLTLHADQVAPAWQLLLLNPIREADWWWGLTALPLVVLGALGAALVARHSRPVATLTVVALLAGVGSVLVPYVSLGSDGDGARLIPWPGTVQQLLAAAAMLLGAAALEAVMARQDDAEAREVMTTPQEPVANAQEPVANAQETAVKEPLPAPDRPTRNPLPAVGLTLTAVGIAAGAVLASLHLPNHLEPWDGGRPTVVAELSSRGVATRMLELTTSADSVGYRLRAQEPASPVDLLAPRPLVTSDDRPIAALAESLADPLADTSKVHGDLLALGIGYVGVRSADQQGLSQELLHTFDSAPGLSRISDVQGMTLWRVQAVPGNTRQVSPSRLLVATARGVPVSPLDSEGAHGRTSTDIPAVGSSIARHLVVAERPQWADRAEVRLNGEPLAQVEGAPHPTYELPSPGGQLTVSLRPDHEPWRLLQAAAGGIALFLALPLGIRRRETS